MNKVIEDQLKKVRVANLPPYNEDTMRLIIPRNDSVVVSDFNIGEKYIIQLEEYLVKPFDGFTLHDNWNNGIPPKHTCLLATVTQVVGNMIKFNASGYNYNTKEIIQEFWSGWLPKKSIKILEIL